jgi:ABC-type branched-subunit amino acid transport system substrate-binding protein
VQDQKDAPQAAEFAKRFKQAFGDEANCHAALAYEGTKLLHEAISRSKDNLTVVRVKEELGKLKDFPGLAGTLSFTPERQLQRPMFVVCIDDTGTKTVKRYVHQD